MKYAYTIIDEEKKIILKPDEDAWEIEFASTNDFKPMYDNIIIQPIRRTPRPHRETGFSEDAAKRQEILFILCRITRSFAAFPFLQSEAS